MEKGQERGAAPEQQGTGVLGESGFEKRGGYSAMEPPKLLPKVQSGPAAGAPAGAAHQSQKTSGGGQQQIGNT
jgi:hypothetical protein